VIIERALKRVGRLPWVGNSRGLQIASDNRFLFGKHLNNIGSKIGPVYDLEAVMEMGL